jgi:hypothetical protein
MPDSGHIPTRIERGNYTADVLHGGNPEPFWYYLIQRKNSKRIINLVKSTTFEEAISAAREVLEKLNRAMPPH